MTAPYTFTPRVVLMCNDIDCSFYEGDLDYVKPGYMVYAATALGDTIYIVEISNETHGKHFFGSLKNGWHQTFKCVDRDTLPVDSTVFMSSIVREICADTATGMALRACARPDGSVAVKRVQLTPERAAELTIRYTPPAE